jgi:hypothetical protein
MLSEINKFHFPINCNETLFQLSHFLSHFPSSSREEKLAYTSVREIKE